MCIWVVPPIARLTEPAVAPEIVADGVGAIEVSNGRIRIYLYTEQLSLDGGCTTPDRVVSAKIVGPVENLPMVIWQLARCLIVKQAPGIVPDEPPPGVRYPHLVP